MKMNSGQRELGELSMMSEVPQTGLQCKWNALAIGVANLSDWNFADTTSKIY